MQYELSRQEHLLANRFTTLENTVGCTSQHSKRGVGTYCICRWAEQDAWPPHQRRHSEDALEGGEEEEPTDGATRMLEGAAGSDEDETDIFLRDASATKGIHCRLGMDGVRTILF